MPLIKLMNDNGTYFIILCGIAIFVLAIFGEKKEYTEDTKVERWIHKYRYYIAGAFMLIGIFVRFFHLDSLPYGLNQDEASMGYDAFSIANFGIDRNGYPLPVYPIAWGAGHGPLYVYIAAIFIKIFGLSVFSYRLGMALLGCGTLILFYCFLKQIGNTKIALLGLFMLVISPWHILLSRWALDSNPVPFFVLLAVFFYIIAIKKQKPVWFGLAGAAFSLSLYTYANTYFAIPVMLIIAGIYGIVYKKIIWKFGMTALITAVVVALPLGVFWVINFFDLAEITTQFISFPKLTVIRSNTLLIALDSHFWENIVINIREYIPYIYLQKEPILYNAIPEYGTLYLFASPLLVLGLLEIIIRYVKNRREYQSDIIMVGWLVGAMVVALLYNALNVNRLSILFIPLIYLCCRGIVLIYHHFKPFVVCILILFVLGFSQFCGTYFGGDYADRFGDSFYESFGEAVQFSQSLPSDEVYVTNKVNGSYLLTLFYLNENPRIFLDTVEYKDNKAEFRQAVSYGKYNFKIPTVITNNKKAVYIVDNQTELSQFPKDLYHIKQYKNYSVVWRTE